jgi:CBS domain-containing protein
MLATTKPFLALTAADLMTRDVLMLPQQTSLRAAAHLLSQAQVSGAPVVDREGRCVGVLSATDFVHWAEQGEGAARPRRTETPCYSAWQVIDLEAVPTEEVSVYMTADPVTVPPRTSLRELARLMLDAHIHRVVVVDPERHPIGIVSSTDILAAVAYADGEQ